MSPLLSKWMQKACIAVHKAVIEKTSRNKLREELIGLTDKILPMINYQERKFLVESALHYYKTSMAITKIRPDSELSFEMTRPCYIKQMERISNQMDRRLQLKAKVNLLSGQLTTGRMKAQVFYMCSIHQTPAERHKHYQGKVFVDRFWRKSMSDCGMEEYIPAVQKYIQDNNCQTVQEAIGAPDYLITRPYCRHYFIPLGTSEVLGSFGTKDIIKHHPEAHMHNKRTDNDAKRAKIYKQRRLTIKNEMKKAEA